MNSLNLLAEFASESENEGALEVVRVQSLSLVGTAYSPLIYNMKQDTSYDQLVGYLKIVHQNLKKNPNLTDKIVITLIFFNKFLRFIFKLLSYQDAIAKEKSWLEEIKDSKGNTEANSLKQAARINKTGIFDFGLKSDSPGQSIGTYVNEF